MTLDRDCLKSLLAERGLKHMWVAQAADMNRANFSAIINGRESLGQIRAIKLTRALRELGVEDWAIAKVFVGGLKAVYGDDYAEAKPKRVRARTTSKSKTPAPRSSATSDRKGRRTSPKPA